MARVQFADVVVSEHGTPVANAMVTITAVSGTSATQNFWEAETGEAKLASVKTNNDGYFSVWLDEGRYDVTPSGASKKRVDIVSASSGGVHSVAGETNVAAGLEALTSLTGGERNSAFGVKALKSANATVKDSTAFGYEALASFTHNSNEEGDNAAFGSKALHSLTTGCGHTAMGFNAGSHLTTGEEWTIFGCEAANQAVTASFGSVFGFRAGNNATVKIDAFGYQAAEKSTSGTGNACFGFQALKNNETGANNCAFGPEALLNATHGLSAAFGSGALKELTTGPANSAFGSGALKKVTTGEENTAVGRVAGENATAGSSGNVFLGFAAGPTAEGAISNKLFVNNAQSANPLIGGVFSATQANTELNLNAAKIGFNRGTATALVNESLSTGTVEGTSTHGFATEAQAIAVAKFCQKFSAWAHESGLTA